MNFETPVDEQCYIEAIEGLKHFDGEYIIKMAKLLDEELKTNAELRKVFEEYPYKRTMYLFKICDS